MPAYHSQFNDVDGVRVVSGMGLYPLKTKVKGPAPYAADPSADDIIDEALNLFRANVFFRNFEIKGNGDRDLIYFILFISECLSKLANMKGNDNKQEAIKVLGTLAVSSFSIPGDPGFPLNGVYPLSQNRADNEQLRQYLQQARQELALRLIDRVYEPTLGGAEAPHDGKPSKWWLCFQTQKRKFMGLSL